MKKIIRKIIFWTDDYVFRHVVKLIYPEYKRPRYGYMLNIHILLKYAIIQKIFRINGNVPWPVDFRSKILGAQFITKGILSDPGDNPGLYINAVGGLQIGNNVAIAANTTITTTNHDMYDHRKVSDVKGVSIGDNVWIGANCSILAGVTIGDNVTIGAGCVIRKDIPSNSIVISSEESLRIVKKRNYKWNVMEELLN